ncbi:RNA helicase [Aphelenchoides fujianensis]|nr:RNA helicase [Aphelenchoides fujianensis]
MLYPRTIADEEEIVEEEFSSESEDEALTVRKKKRRAINSGGFSNDFHFEDGEEEAAADHLDGIQHYLKNTVASSLQEKIDEERKLQKLDKKVVLGGKIEAEEEAQAGEEKGLDQLMETSDKLREKKLKGKKAVVRKEDFFDPSSSEISTPEERADVLRDAIMDCGYTNPTPIQAACIPVALAGKDICACSSTGTGKTAAFMLPILERLLYRPKQHRSVTRVLVLAPTRELAIQIFQVTRRLAQFSSVEICLCAGGLDLKAQEAALRLGLDIVIATPGRLIDHLHNSPNFSLLDVEVLVLDEADRMLEEQFIIRLCAKNRQTMLFSATMTDEVEDLARMSLNTPVRLSFESAKGQVVNAYHERITSLGDSISRIQQQEAEEKAARSAQSVMQKAENLMNNVPDERANRVWFQEAEDKRQQKRKLREAKRIEKAKLAAQQKTPEERKMENLMSFQARQAKRAKRLKRLRVVEDDDEPKKKRKTGGKPKRKRSNFTAELTDVGRRSLKNARSGPDDVGFKKAKAAMKKKGSLKGPRK